MSLVHLHTPSEKTVITAEVGFCALALLVAFGFILAITWGFVPRLPVAPQAFHRAEVRELKTDRLPLAAPKAVASPYDAGIPPRDVPKGA